MKSCRNMVFATPFQRLKIVGNPYIFCSATEGKIIHSHDESVDKIHKVMPRMIIS